MSGNLCPNGHDDFYWLVSGWCRKCSGVSVVTLLPDEVTVTIGRVPYGYVSFPNGELVHQLQVWPDDMYESGLGAEDGRTACGRATENADAWWSPDKSLESHPSFCSRCKRKELT